MAGLVTQSQENYYQQSQSFNGDGSTKIFLLTTLFFPSLPSAKVDIRVFVGGEEIDTANYSYSSDVGVTFTGRTDNEDVLADGTGGTTEFAPINAKLVLVKERAASENFGTYQYVSLDNIVNNFLIAYVGEGKIISKVKKTDINFHAKRGLAEFSYDTLHSEKSQEIEVPPSLLMILPHDYVNYVKLSYSDSSGIERILYPTRPTSNPKSLLQDDNYDYLFDNTDGSLLEGQPSQTWDRYKTGDSSSSENVNNNASADVDWRYTEGKRFGIEPENAQSNGSFFIDHLLGRIHFSSNLSGKILILKYISDRLGTDNEMRVHKFAEEAIYKHIAYAVLSSKLGIPEYVVARYKKERYAALRNAKIRLSNLKSEELAQVMRNKSKWIKS
jgi:hypothetical protein